MNLIFASIQLMCFYYLQQLLTSCYCPMQENLDAKVGITFSYYDTISAIYGSNIATGEHAQGIGEVVANLEEEIVAEHGNKLEKEDDRMSRETPRLSLD